MARDDIANNQAEIKSYDINAVEWPVNEIEEDFFNVQQEHDYIVPLKDESSFSDSDDDTMDDTDNVEVKHESTDDHILEDKTAEGYEHNVPAVDSTKVAPGAVINRNDPSSSETDATVFRGFNDFENVTDEDEKLISLTVLKEHNYMIPATDETNFYYTGAVDNTDNAEAKYKQADNFKNLRELDVATTDDTCSETITDDCSLAKCDVMFGKNYADSSDDEACKTTKDGRRKKRTKRRPIRRRAICRKPVSNDYDSELHPRRPGGGIRRQFGCSDCDEFFCQNSPQRLNHIDSKHRSSTSVQYEFHCVRCNVGFAQKQSLIKHAIAYHHRHYDDSQKATTPESVVQKPVYPCPVCCKVFTHDQRMRQDRLRVVQIGFRHTCLWCSKSYFCKQKLTNHLRVHFDIKPFPCDTCGLRFNKKYTGATSYRRLHTGERPFICTYCQRAFNQSVRLKAHLTTHTGQYAYCAVCNRAFAHKSYIIRHFKMHVVPEKRTKTRKMAV